MGFREYPHMGFGWVQKWVLTRFDPLLHPKTHFRPIFGPISAHWQKTHLKPTLSGNKLFPRKKALRQPWPSIILSCLCRSTTCEIESSNLSSTNASWLKKCFWLQWRHHLYWATCSNTSNGGRGEKFAYQCPEDRNLLKLRSIDSFCLFS